MTEHAPWKADETRVYTGDGGFDIRNLPNAAERAAFIVKAVNSHVALVTNLKLISDWRKVDMSGEYEHGLRDVIRSMLDCADRALASMPS